MMWTIAIIIILVAILVLLRKKSKTKKLNNNKDRQLAKIPGFEPTVRYEPGAQSVGLALDVGNEKFAIIKPNESAKVYGFSQLVSVDVEKNGTSLQKTNRGSQIAGAAVGAVLLGPLGLLLGGLTGSKKNIEKVKRLSLKLFTTDVASPATEIVFFENPAGSDPNGFFVKNAAQNLDEWHARLLTILRGAN